MSFKSVVSKVASNIGHFFKRIWSSDEARQAQKILVDKLLPIAIDAVERVEQLTGLDGTAKRDEAAKIIYNQLGPAGKSVEMQMVHLAIQLALATISGLFKQPLP